MEYRIQSLVFPTDEKHQQCRKLFYRGDHAILDTEKKTITMGFAQRCDFVTYLNACSYEKWQRYTHAGRLTLHLEFEGEAELYFMGYHKEALTVFREDFGRQKIASKKRKEFTYTFPENQEQMVGFEITALSTCTIYGGYYTVEVAKKDLNNVTLAVATTTCKKEEYIKKNVALIRSELLESDDDIAKNLYLHVVDNGRTLKKSDVTGPHITLHPNPNAGGSGGYARGMIESMHQRPKATHTLLMDDDVLVLPESIRRTYKLLRLLKPEYKDHFISGAMLYYEDPKCQHEDIGTIEEIDNNLAFRPMKDPSNLESITNCLSNEREYTQHKNGYAAWWYCCIPMHIIEKTGLPLPIFIRCDDMEYSLRAKAQIITMNGICIWHMGFVTKYNAAFDRYQQYRNMLIAKAAHNLIPEIDVMKVVYSAFRVELLKFNYDTAELILRALEDYLRGPDFIKTADGEKIANDNFKLNDKLVPLSQLPDGNSFKPEDCYMDFPRKFIDRVILKVTWNGQRWCPKFLERPEVAPIAADWLIQPQKITLRNKMIAVNPHNRTGVYRIKDKARFRDLKSRYNQAAKFYRANHLAIEKAYRDSAKEITSEKFWRKYLGMK